MRAFGRLLLSTLIAGSAGDPSAGPLLAQSGPGAAFEKRRAELVMEFDRNGDSWLDADERTQMGRQMTHLKSKWRREKGEIRPPAGSIETHDKEETPIARVPPRQQRWLQFDFDGDGKASGVELEAIRQAEAGKSPVPAIAPRAAAASPKPTAPQPPRAVKLGEVLPVSINHSRGWYEQPVRIVLKCSTPAAEIRYTTDGAVPAATSGTLYTEPFTIDETTVLRVGSFKPGYKPAPITTHTFLLPSCVVRQSADGLPPVGFPYSWGANRVSYGMDPRVVNDPRFHDEIGTGLKSIPSVSLVMNLDDLFGAQDGIYANAERDGRAWERPGSIEFIRADGKEGFQIDCGVRIRGGFSRTPENPKHSFRLFFRSGYGHGSLKYPLFGDKGAREFDKLDLRTSQNYSWNMGDPHATFVRDQVNRDLLAAMGQPSARGDFCHLFINGQYWGLYDTCERPEASFAKSYFGGKKGDYDVIKNNSGGNGLAIMATDGNLDAWERLHRRAEPGLRDNSAYFAIQGRHPDGTPDPKGEVLLDVDNLIDYMLVIFYGGNLDGPASWFGDNRWSNNWYGIRNRKGKEGFRFFVWDAEHTFLLDGPNDGLYEDRTGPFHTGDIFACSNPQGLWQKCLENPEFRLRVTDRVWKYFSNGGVLTPDAVRRLFASRTKEIESAVICESARWGDSSEYRNRSRRGPLNRDDHWRREVKRILADYIPRRSDIVLGQLFRHGLLPDVDPPQFNRFGGSVRDGWRLELSAPKGRIYFTTDGSDPRRVGGGVSSTAREYESASALKGSTTVRARAFYRAEWSALAEASFHVERDDRSRSGEKK